MPPPRAREYPQLFSLNKQFTNIHANTATPPSNPKVPDSEFDFVIDLEKGTVVENKKPPKVPDSEFDFVIDLEKGTVVENKKKG